MGDQAYDKKFCGLIFVALAAVALVIKAIFGVLGFILIVAAWLI